MFEFKIEIDTAKFNETLKVAGAVETYETLLDNLSARIQSSVMVKTPVAKVGAEREGGVYGGSARRSWFIDKPGPLERVVVNRAKYAIFLEEGTVPHRIEPKTKKALAWQVGLGIGNVERTRTTSKLTNKPLKNPVNESFIVVKGVNHPGTKPLHMLESTIKELEPWFNQTLNETILNIWSQNVQ